MAKNMCNVKACEMVLKYYGEEYDKIEQNIKRADLIQKMSKE